MIAELERNKAAAARGEEESLGYLGSRSTVDLTGTTMIQWWRSTEDIYAYASAPDHRHRPAWLEFYRPRARRPTRAHHLARDVRRRARWRRERLRRPASRSGSARSPAPSRSARRGETRPRADRQAPAS